MNVTTDVYYDAQTAQIACPPPWRAWDALAAAFSPVFLWRDRTDSGVFLSIGCSQEFSSLSDCRDALSGLRIEGLPDEMAPRCFGMIAFDADAPLVPPWERFRPRLFALPDVMIHWREDQTFLAAFSKAGERMLRDVTAMLQYPPPPIPPLIVDGNRTLSKPQWDRAVQIIRSEIAAEHVVKVVLSRDSIREATAPISAAYVLDRLAASARDCYLFAHGCDGSTFLGASPERVAYLDDRVVETESLAGTRPRGHSPEEDARLAEELLASKKENAEQKIVTTFIVSQLSQLCARVETDLEPSVAKLATVQHLRTRIRGELKANVSPDAVMNALHPTPAVCGMPRVKSREMVTELEPVPRGLYAGAVGWIDAERAEFAVAIRSALLRGRFAHVFGGAGIVAGSDANAEWRETALKMKPMLAALNCEDL